MFPHRYQFSGTIQRIIAWGIPHHFIISFFIHSNSIVLQTALQPLNLPKSKYIVNSSTNSEHYSQNGKGETYYALALNIRAMENNYHTVKTSQRG